MRQDGECSEHLWQSFFSTANQVPGIALIIRGRYCIRVGTSYLLCRIDMHAGEANLFIVVLHPEFGRSQHLARVWDMCRSVEHVSMHITGTAGDLQTAQSLSLRLTPSVVPS